jgi:hypothetical protein
MIGKVLDSRYHGWFVVGMVRHWTLDRRRRRSLIDLINLVLVCGKQHILLMLIILIMTLVIGQMQLDHNACTREQKD